jgi:hypothetical protein
VKNYILPVVALSISLAASQMPSPVLAEGRPETMTVAAVTAQPRHPAESIRIGTLDLNSDFSIFMDPGCPEPVRRSALRRLWSLLPPGEEGSPWH